MHLNSEQQTAIAAGEPVALSISGMECVILRKERYLEIASEFDSEPLTGQEMNLLADEMDELLTRQESHES